MPIIKNVHLISVQSRAYLKRLCNLEVIIAKITCKYEKWRAPCRTVQRVIVPVISNLRS